MKRMFEGVKSSSCPYGWDGRIGSNYMMHSSVLRSACHSDTPFYYVTHPQFICCEYKTRLNLFTFGSLKLNIPVTVVGLPLSVSSAGYSGDLSALINDYRAREGIVLVLNLPSTDGLPHDVARGDTLGDCIFSNRFYDFGEYLATLRSGYRRRIKSALSKKVGLTLRPIKPGEFNDGIYALYLNVFNRSRYPLEKLKKEFFKEFGGELFLYEHDGAPAAFFLIKESGKALHFIFGGMDYNLRDTFDLYVNMLCDIVKIGIGRGFSEVSLGQTAESTKLRLGALYRPLYMAAFSKNPVLNLLLRVLSPLLSYSFSPPDYRVFGEHR